MNTTTLSIIQPRSDTGRVVTTVLGLWFVAAALASVSNLPMQTPWMLPFLVSMPLTLFGLTWLFSPGFRGWALGLDQRFLILLHTTRTLGLGFVMLYFYDSLPPAFAFSAGLGDAATAIWALFLGVALYQGANIGNRAIYNWNTFGLLDFVAAVVLGLASRSAPVGLIADGISSDAVGIFPLSIVPLFVVPFFVMTHLIIYAQLRLHR